MNTGLCPHGLPPGACPICSAGTGGMRLSDRNRKIGEMTYHECAMIGNMMRARKRAQQAHEMKLERWQENLRNYENAIAKLSERLMEFAKLISNNILLKPTAFVIKNIAVPLVNFIRNIPNIILNITEKFVQIKQKFVDIMDKLTAIFGELKAFIDKKVSELISSIKTKLKNLFKIFKKHDADDEDTKIDDDKKIFNLKTLINKINTKIKRKKEKNA